ncbi:undecaprenyl-diphosphatase [Thermanaeromonas toyohensis ToBE]|uniref:Undecaprenyl-diphosphatase n=1 Tax=Thermanaeromonas toyohensis ToBE TaxID=698762 RepID=A0A1W1VXP2_9FIRM|nr:phosphatase PAP2 family protein [Thermanaeromonas toyohensis]SMB98125.1 undecaprenyl-diphosphatase [Thermanaeromonas toyohensis ToBE]
MPKRFHITWTSVAILALLFTLLGIYYARLNLWDQAIINFVGKATLQQGNSFYFIFVFLNWWGTKGGMFFTSAAGVVVLTILYRRVHEGLSLAGGMFSGWGFLELSKIFFRRGRPEGVYLFPASGYSFPSGHAFITLLFTALFISLSLPMLNRFGHSQRLGWLKVTFLILYVVLGALTLATGWSRIYFGMHYPTDVLGGWLAGAFWATLWRLTTSSAN